MTITKGAINSNIPINDDDGLAWDSGAAIKNIKAWASDADGNIDFAKYQKAFFWVDPENKDKQGGYKLPFADVFDGDLKAVWRGVSGAMAALMGSRGGVDIPDNDRKPVYDAIVKYYKKFDKEPPEFKDFEINHVKAFYDPETKTAIASTDSVDRMGEVIDQNGWDLANFKSNPVLLWAHDDKTPRIGLAQNIRVEKSGTSPALMFEPKFNEHTELSRAIKAIFEEDGGTFSVGFMPLDMDGNTYTKAELLEISAVNVPANPDARTLAYRNLRTHGISKSIAAQVSGVKGAIQDEIDAEAAMEQKCDNMEDFWEVVNAFCDVYFDQNTRADQFQSLMNEFVSIMQKIADGTYQDPDDAGTTPDQGDDMQEPMMQMSIFRKVLDNRAKGNRVKGNKAKEPSSAPQRKHLEEGLRFAKIIAKSAELLARDGKLPEENRKDLNKIMKRSAEIIIERNKTELKNHG